MSAQACAQLIFCTMAYFNNINNMWKFQLCTLLRQHLTVYFCKKKKPCSFLAFFPGFLAQHKNAHISTNRQNKHQLWVFIFLVRTQEIIWYRFYFDPLNFFV